MNRNLLITIMFIFGSLGVAEVNGQTIGHTFTYQGELVDAGKPANDDYDITIQGYDSQAGGVVSGSLSTHVAVTVEKGLFTLDSVDLGAATFDGKELWLEVSVRKTSDGGSYTALAPRQSLKAVPYAKTLTNGSATTGQVLTFDGSQWAPATATESPWIVSGNKIFYTAGRVGIGRTPVTTLDVEGTNELVARFNGPDRVYVLVEENGESRGYIGSYQHPNDPGINDEDFEIGTYGGSTGNMHIVTGDNEPRITVTAEGKVGINNTTPDADLDVQGTDDTHVAKVRVRVGGETKFLIINNGGTTIGGAAIPPDNGLHVAGGAKLKGGVVIGNTIASPPSDGLRVTDGVGIGNGITPPPTNGLVVRGETTLNSNLEVNGNVAVSGEINSADSGTADMKAYVYGFANSDGTILTNKSSVGFTSVAKEATGQYKVSFTDTNINNNYIATVTLNSSSPKFATVVDSVDFFRVYVWDKNGDPSNHAFQFVVYRK